MRTIILLWKVNKWEADTFWSFVKCLSHLLLLGMRCRTTDIIMSSKERKETSKVSPWFVNMRTWWCPLRIFRIVGAWANPRSLFPENGLICYCTWKVLGQCLMPPVLNDFLSIRVRPTWTLLDTLHALLKIERVLSKHSVVVAIPGAVKWKLKSSNWVILPLFTLFHSLTYFKL